MNELPSQALPTSSLPMSARHRSYLAPLADQERVDLPKFVESIERDYQFKLGSLVIQSVIQSTQVKIHVEQAKADDADVEQIQVFADNMKSTWQKMLPSALLAFGHGRAAFEKTYRYDKASRLALLADLDYLPTSVTNLVLDAHGSFAGIDLLTGRKKVRLEPARSWWFALDANILEPHGKSRYLGAAFDVYRQRQKLAKQEEIWFSKFAIGHGVARAPEREDIDPVLPNDATDAASADPMEVMRQRCLDIESGGILVLSSRKDASGSYLYDYAATDGQKDSTPLENRRRQLDVAALRSLGIPERAVSQDVTTGSYALAVVHQQVLFKTCEGILAQLVASYQKYVIDKAVEVNWPENRRPICRLEYQPVGESNSRASSELPTSPASVSQTDSSMIGELSRSASP